MAKWITVPAEYWPEDRSVFPGYCTDQLEATAFLAYRTAEHQAGHHELCQLGVRSGPRARRPRR
ncbi:MAG: hypothetical protein M0T79_00470 [Actinomycetota bacterium]|nr:hypothetical protein [Actinomycetota bacterium]